MSAIEVKNIEVPMVELFNPEGESLGVINEYQFHDVRVQIKEAKVRGYYIEYKGQKSMIDHQGRLELWYDGMFDQINHSLLQLL